MFPFKLWKVQFADVNSVKKLLFINVMLFMCQQIHLINSLFQFQSFFHDGVCSHVIDLHTIFYSFCSHVCIFFSFLLANTDATSSSKKLVPKFRKVNDA